MCDSCKEIRAGNSLDVVEIDAATNRGIDEIRELRDAARYAPARDRYKIYLLDEAHQITDAAFNALLKTLEEPPAHVVFMMATTQPEDIPQTIRSRCQHFSFHAVKFEDIVQELTQIAAKEGILADPQALALLAEAGDGSMRDALSIMDQAIASAPMVEGQPRLDGNEIRELMGTVPDAVFERVLEAIGEGQSAAVMEELNRLLNAGNSPSQMARQMVRYLRNCLMAKLGGEQTELLQISGDERARAVRTATIFGEEDLTRFLQVMLRTFDELNYRQEPRLHLELGLMKLVHLQRLLPLEQILSALPGAARSAPRPLSGAAGTPRITARPVTPTAPAVAPRAATSEPARPAAVRPVATPLSPFELDRQRKLDAGTEEGHASVPAPVSHAVLAEEWPMERPSVVSSVISPSVLMVGSAVAVIEEPISSLPDPPAILSELVVIPISETAAAAVEPVAMEDELPAESSTVEPATKESTPASDLDSLRDAVSSALDEQGHNTAASLLGAGRWKMDEEGAIQVEVGRKENHARPDHERRGMENSARGVAPGGCDTKDDGGAGRSDGSFERHEK